MLKRTLLSLLILICTSIQSFSATNNIKNNGLSCSAKHLDTGKLVEVKTVTSITTSKVATAYWPLGYPTIAINDSVFSKLPKSARQFVYYHECAHLKFRSKNEHQMDCESIKLLVVKMKYSKVKLRRLIKTLVQEFGLSKRWSNLLACDGFQNTD